MRRNLFVLLSVLLMLASAMPAHAACTAANPNANVAESTPDSDLSVTTPVAGQSVVTHAKTGLMWKQCSEGQSGAGCATGAASTMTWQNALKAANTANTAVFAGYSDWRLPNVKELESIVEYCGYTPAINQTKFPLTPASKFWSASSFVPDTLGAWNVNFDHGYIIFEFDYKPTNFYVRLVRGGQSFDSFDALGDVTAPVLSAIGVSGTTSTATTLSATSNENATGYWVVIARNAAAPTAAQVKAGVSYGAVTVVASGNGAMTAAVAKTFAVAGLSAGADYDLYIVAEDASPNTNLGAVGAAVQFTTLIAADGSGTLTVLPTTTTNPAQNLTFTYTAATGGLNNGEIDINHTCAVAGTTSNGSVACIAGLLYVTGINLAGGATMTITNNSLSLALGVNSFSTMEKSTAGGTLTALASSPTVTLYQAPTATSVAASGLGATGATLNGNVNDNFASTAVTFDYGLTAGYGSNVAATTLGSGTVAAGAGSTAVAVNISSLTCNTTYHYRVNGVNSAGTTNGGDLSFTTSACPINGVCGSASGTTSPFAPQANLCTTGNASSVTSGSGTYGWTCSGSNGGIAAACSANWQTTGSGLGTSSVAGNTWAFAPQGNGALQTAGFIPVSGHPKSPPNLPPGFSFPHGLFDFVLTAGTAGSAATITITYPSALPAGAVYWKYGPSPAGNNCTGAACAAAHWYQFPAVIAGNTATLTITDGGLGDDDLTANGVIVDQGGPGVPGAGGASSIPTLSEWGMILLAGLLGLFGMVGVRRRVAA